MIIAHFSLITVCLLYPTCVYLLADVWWWGEWALRNLQQKPKMKKPVGVRNGDAAPDMTEFSRGRAAGRHGAFQSAAGPR